MTLLIPRRLLKVRDCSFQICSWHFSTKPVSNHFNGFNHKNKVGFTKNLQFTYFIWYRSWLRSVQKLYFSTQHIIAGWFKYTKKKYSPTLITLSPAFLVYLLLCLQFLSFLIIVTCSYVSLFIQICIIYFV